LGLIFSSGKDVTKDTVEGKKWFYKAAEQGDGFSQFALAKILEREKNDVEAAKWYCIASKKGIRERIFA